MKVTGVLDVNEELIHILPIYSKSASNSRPIPLGTHSIHPYQSGGMLTQLIQYGIAGNYAKFQPL